MAYCQYHGKAVTCTAANSQLTLTRTRMPPVEVHRPLLLIYSFQFRSTFRATTTPSQQRALDCTWHRSVSTTTSQPQIRHPYKAPTSITHRQACEINSIDNAQVHNSHISEHAHEWHCIHGATTDYYLAKWHLYSSDPANWPGPVNVIL